MTKNIFAKSILSGVTLLASGQLAHAACGVFEVSKGDVKVQSGKSKAIAAAPVGTKVCSGDKIIAGKDSRAKLIMDDKNELNISPETNLVLEDYQFDPATNKKKVLLNVLQGKLRFATKTHNMYNDKSADGSNNSFQVKTKSAVAGVRGTIGIVEFNPLNGLTKVGCESGALAVGTPGPGNSIQNAVSVKEGTTTSVAVGEKPTPPKPGSLSESSQGSSESSNKDDEKKEEKKDDNKKDESKKEEGKQDDSKGDDSKGEDSKGEDGKKDEAKKDDSKKEDSKKTSEKESDSNLKLFRKSCAVTERSDRARRDRCLGGCRKNTRNAV